MQLFMVYLGGRVTGCHIEMHDVRFVIGEKIEDCFSKLKQQWVGDKNQVHMDSYVKVNYVDGYQITVSEEAQKSDKKLYFVNLGAYTPEQLAEQHAFGLFVAASAEEAKFRAKTSLLVGMPHQHKDNLYDVDDCFAIDLFDQQHQIQLTPTDKRQNFKPDWFGYHIL